MTVPIPLWLGTVLVVLGGLVLLVAVLLALAILIGGEQLVDELVDDLARLGRLVRRCGHRVPVEMCAHRKWLGLLSRLVAGGRGLPTGRHHKRTPASTTPAPTNSDEDRSPVNTPPALVTPPALLDPEACPVCLAQPQTLEHGTRVTVHRGHCAPQLVAAARVGR